MCSVLKDRERERDYWLTRHRIDCMEKKKKKGGRGLEYISRGFSSRARVADGPL